MVNFQNCHLSQFFKVSDYKCTRNIILIKFSAESLSSSKSLQFPFILVELIIFEAQIIFEFYYRVPLMDFTKLYVLVEAVHYCGSKAAE